MKFGFMRPEVKMEGIMDKIRMGIVGFGNMGKNHARMILRGETPEIELAAIADHREVARVAASEIVPDSVKIFSSAEEMFESGCVDAVLIATQHIDHPRLTVEALEAGLHVLCEKPAGVYTKQVREMNEFAAAKKDLVFAMMFNQRTNHVYRKMHELVHSGKYGEIKRVNWIITDWYRTQAYYDSGAWRATWRYEGGGVLLNQCPHNLDLLQWICGMPCSVRAFCHEGKWHHIEVEDDVTAYFEYPNGATGVFITSTGDLPGTNRLEVSMEGAQLRTDGNTLEIFELSENERETCFNNPEGFYRPAGEWKTVETDGENPQHKGVLNAFAGRILHGTPLVAEGWEGINGLLISNAMHLSSWTGQEVRFPFDESLYEAELKRKAEKSKKLAEMENPQ